MLEGDHYVLIGQKVWTTNGQWADLGYLLARTDPAAPKHKGITAFALDMRLPWVTVRPLREITGTSDFNEVFLDEVRVPVEAVIGKPGQGWQIANTSLVHERSGVGASVVALERNWSRLRELAAATGRLDDTEIRTRSPLSSRRSRRFRCTPGSASPAGATSPSGCSTPRSPSWPSAS